MKLDTASLPPQLTSASPLHGVPIQMRPVRSATMSWYLVERQRWRVVGIINKVSYLHLYLSDRHHFRWFLSMLFPWYQKWIGIDALLGEDLPAVAQSVRLATGIRYSVGMRWAPGLYHCDSQSRYVRLAMHSTENTSSSPTSSLLMIRVIFEDYLCPGRETLSARGFPGPENSYFVIFGGGSCSMNCFSADKAPVFTAFAVKITEGSSSWHYPEGLVFILCEWNCFRQVVRSIGRPDRRRATVSVRSSDWRGLLPIPSVNAHTMPKSSV